MKSDGVHVLVKDEGEGDDEAEDGVTLRTDGVGENLESVGHNQGREGDVVRGIEQEDEGNDGVSSRSALGDSVTGGADSLEGEEEQHANARGDKKDPSPNTFDERGGSDSPCKIPNLEDTVDEELGSCIGDTNGLEYFVEVVGDETISGPLREPSDSDDNRQAFAVTGGLDQGHPTNGGTNSPVEIDGGPDFFVLVLNERILLIAISVIVGQGVESLGIPALATSQRGDSGPNQRRPSWRTEGAPWRADGILQDQDELILKVPKVLQAATIAPEYQREL